MSSHLEGLEVEAVEAGRRGIEMSECFHRPWRSPPSPYELAKAAVSFAAQEIRKQERQRIREALEKRFRKHDVVGFTQVEAFLDSLEDSDAS
jgi:hypothetical protein